MSKLLHIRMISSHLIDVALHVSFVFLMTLIKCKGILYQLEAPHRKAISKLSSLIDDIKLHVSTKID